MKQKDLALIIVIAGLSGFVSFFVSNKIFVTDKARHQEYEVVDAINPSFELPNKKYFNNDSVNAAPSTDIAGNNNQDPFNGNNQ